MEPNGMQPEKSWYRAFRKPSVKKTGTVKFPTRRRIGRQKQTQKERGQKRGRQKTEMTQMHTQLGREAKGYG